MWITIPVWKKGLGLQKISDIRICHEGRWAEKHLESLQTAYRKAPYLSEHLELLQQMFSEENEKLIDLNLTVIRYLMKTLDMRTKTVLLSDLDVSSTGNRRLVDICKKTGATQFLAQAPAKKFIDDKLFLDAGIELRFFTPPTPVYPQLWGNFLANLSILDLVLNCGPKAREMLFGLRKKNIHSIDFI